MCVCACTLCYGVYVWMQTESAFTERFMLIVMNGSCWSGKGEGQTEGKTLSEIGKKSKKRNLTLLHWVIFFLFYFVCLVPVYYFITPPTNYLFTFFFLCGVYWFSWSQFTLIAFELLGLISENKMDSVFFIILLLVACDIRLWSQFSGSILLPAGHFRSGLQLPHFHLHPLGSPSICIPPLTTFLPPFTYPLWILAAWCLCRDLPLKSTALFWHQ